MQTEAQKALVSLTGNGLADKQVAALFGCKAIEVTLIRTNAVHLNPTGHVEKLMNDSGTTAYLEDHIIALASSSSIEHISRC